MNEYEVYLLDKTKPFTWDDVDAIADRVIRSTISECGNWLVFWVPLTGECMWKVVWFLQNRHVNLTVKQQVPSDIVWLERENVELVIENVGEIVGLSDMASEAGNVRDGSNEYPLASDDRDGEEE